MLVNDNITAHGSSIMLTFSLRACVLANKFGYLCVEQPNTIHEEV
jgi:hypothetical protein